MNKYFVVIACMLFWSLPVGAQDAVDTDVITSVKRGQPAPYDGQLFDIQTAIRWGQWLKGAQERLQLQADRDKSLCQVELDYQEEIASVQIYRIDELNKDLTMRLKRSETARAKAEYERDNPAWYTSAWFGLGLGVLGTVGLVYAGSQAF